MNKDVKSVEMKGRSVAGLHFCLVKDICNYLWFGTKLALVNAFDDVYVDDGKFCTYRIVIEVVMPFGKTATWNYLYEHRADITADNNCVDKLSAESRYFEVVKYLRRNGAGIIVFNHYCTSIQALRIIIWKRLDKCIRKTGTRKH